MISPQQRKTTGQKEESQLYLNSGQTACAAVMSVSLSTMKANRGYHQCHTSLLTKGSPGGRGAGFYPSPLPGPQQPRYIDILHPLKSLGRLVSDTQQQQASMPLNFAGGAPPFLGHQHHQHHHHHASVQHVLQQHSIPYLNHMLPGHHHGVYPRHHEELVAAVVTADHHHHHRGAAGAGPLSLSDFFGSPSSDRSSSASTSPPKQDVSSSFLLRGAEDHHHPPMKKTRTYSFSEDDLFTVLYGSSSSPRSQQQNAGHAATSSVALLAEKTVSDSRILPMDTETLELPEGLTVLQTTCGNVSHYGVFTTDKSGVPKGTRFGPFQGKLVNTSEIKTYDDNTLMWEVFENGRLSHFVDGRGSSGNWMSLVKCARFPEEQNLVAVQVQGQIFYEACKEVTPGGQELLVWYGDCYVQFLGIPLTLKVSTEDSETQRHPPEDSAEGFKCDRCGKVFAYRYYRDKHLKYTRCVDQGDRKFPCQLCSRSFEKRDRLRIHILHVHEKHRPHKCSVCAKSFSQSSSLNKHMRVHSGERPYKCVYCNKAFTASSILRTHIRQHSGERPFKCKHCGKAFASHAAHDSHVRRTHASKEQASPCDVCGETFQDVQALKNHMKKHRSPLESTIVPSPPPANGSLDEAMHPVKDKSITQRHTGLNFPFTGLTVINPEYRPWN